MTLPRLIKEAEPSERAWRISIRDAINGIIKRLMGTGNVRPDNPTSGTMFVDEALGKPIWYINGGWVDASGASV